MSKTIATKAAKGKSAGGKAVAKAVTSAKGGKAPGSQSCCRQKEDGDNRNKTRISQGPGGEGGGS